MLLGNLALNLLSFCYTKMLLKRASSIPGMDADKHHQKTISKKELRYDASLESNKCYEIVEGIWYDSLKICYFITVYTEIREGCFFFPTKALHYHINQNKQSLSLKLHCFTIHTVILIHCFTYLCTCMIMQQLFYFKTSAEIPSLFTLNHL